MIGLCYCLHGQPDHSDFHHHHLNMKGISFGAMLFMPSVEFHTLDVGHRRCYGGANNLYALIRWTDFETTTTSNKCVLILWWVVVYVCSFQKLQ